MLKHKGTVTIETPRLILRRAKTEDAEPMFRNWANDADVTKNLGSAVGYLYNIYDEEDYSSVVCTCTKDTSGQGLPVIGGGYKEPIGQTQCSICTSH